MKGDRIRWDDYGYEEARELVEKGRAEYIEPQKREREAEKRTEIKDGFIFDPSQVFRRAIFPFAKLSDGEYAFGIVLPRWVDDIDARGRRTGEKTQIWVPVFITSNEEWLITSDRALKERLVRVENAPEDDSYPQRWSLPSIESYLMGKSQQIEARELFERIRGLYEEYLYFSPSYWYDVHALWDMMTYCFLLFNYVPLLELRGLSGTAKTKIMTLSRQITFNATEEMTDPSAPTLFRVTDAQRPTKYIDEAERLFPIVKGKVEQDERAELINASYKASGSVPRQEKIGNRFKTIWYSAYSPTMIGSIQGLHGATENRAIVHVTQKNRPGDPRANRDPDSEDERFKRVRDDLYIFVLQNASEIKRRYDEYDNKKVEGREASLLKPLLVLAQMSGDDLHDRLLPSLVSLLEKRSMNAISEGSWEYAILKAVRDIVFDGFYDHPDRGVLVKSIITRMDIEGDRKPGSKSVTNILDKFGFLDLKIRWNNGTGYRDVTEDFIGAILTAQCPELIDKRVRSEDSSSFSSSSSLTHESLSEANPELVKNGEGAREANVENEANEGDGVREVVSSLDSGDGALLSELLKRLKQEQIDRALKLGEIFEFKAGRFKVMP